VRRGSGFGYECALCCWVRPEAGCVPRKALMPLSGYVLLGGLRH
jgi:hypothetical protein